MNRKTPPRGRTVYRFHWHRQGRKGQLCTVFARGTLNSCGVMFADGYCMVTSRNALRVERKGATA